MPSDPKYINEIIRSTRGVPTENNKYIYDITEGDLNSISLDLENQKTLNRRVKLAEKVRDDYSNLLKLLNDLPLCKSITFFEDSRKRVIVDINTTRVNIAISNEFNFDTSDHLEEISRIFSRIVEENTQIYVYNPTFKEKIKSFLTT
jgi:hypothetical protein